MSRIQDRPRDDRGRFVGKDDEAGEPAKPARKPARGRAPAKGSIRWTKAKEAVFFCELAMVCNVSSALRAAKLAGCSSLAYERRKKDKAFRGAWEAAIDQSYAMLELEMLERARFGKDRPPPSTEAEKRLRAIPDALALQLLKLYENRVKSRASPAPGRGSGAAEPRLTRQRRAELRREFDALLSDFNRRMGGEG
jgi:hypothetical protein